MITYSLRPRLYVAAVLVLAIGVAALAWVRTTESVGTVAWYYAAVLAALIGLAARYPLVMGGKSRVLMDTAAVIAAIILLPPVLALATCVAGKAIGQCFRRPQPIRAVFNISAMGLQTGVAGLIFASIARTEIPYGIPSEFPAVVAAALVLYLLNALVTEGVVALSTGRPLFQGWWSTHHEDLLHQASLLLVGVFAALSAEGRPWALPLIVAPSAIVYRSLRHQHLSLERAEAGQARAEQERERLAGVVEATSDLVCTINPDGRLLDLNAAGRLTLRVSPEADLSAFRASDLIEGWDAMAASAVVDGAWAGEGTIRGLADSLRVPVSQVVMAHRDIGGKVEFLSMIARDISDRKEFEAEMVRLASHDALTGLLNRRRFDEKLDAVLSHSRRAGSHGALLFVDLDGFKAVNDSLGHQVGDKLLASIANRLLSCVGGRSDSVARLGGDEFAVLLPGASAAQATLFAGEIVEAIRDHRLTVLAQPVGLTASVGVALYPEHGGSPIELMAHADAAMYQAKEERGRFTVFNPARAEHPVLRGWEDRIRAALEHGHFVVHAQEIRPLAGGQPMYELLLRLADDDGHLVAPGVFLPVAERAGLIEEVDRWVIDAAIKLAGEHPTLAFGVNVSAATLGDIALTASIEASIRASGIDARNLVFEVTETTAVAELGWAHPFIERLQALGCRFAIDDFGAGSSSLAYLKSLPVEFLKIDGSFIRDLSHSPIDQQLVRGIIDMARALGKQTIAEFVGDEASLQLLRTLGADYVQGYHIARPAPLAEVLGADRVALPQAS